MSLFPSQKREIPFLSVPDINKIDDYIPFGHVISYLKSRSDHYKNKHELLLRCGYGRNSFNKFCIREAGWITLKRNVPLKYLDAIGAELPEIRKAVEVDKEQYKNVLNLPFFPKNAVVRVMPTVYSQYKFEPFTSEAEAVEIMKTCSKEKGFRTCINYPGIKSIWVEPSGAIKHSYYYPKLTFTKDGLIPSYTGEGIGKAFSGSR